MDDDEATKLLAQEALKMAEKELATGDYCHYPPEYALMIQSLASAVLRVQTERDSLRAELQEANSCNFLSAWKAVQRTIKESNQAHGWYDAEIHDAIRIALMHSELSEALEYLRHDNPQSDHIPLFSGVEEELADVVIRVMDMAEIRELRVSQAIMAKIEFNWKRPFKHGGKKF